MLAAGFSAEQLGRFFHGLHTGTAVATTIDGLFAEAGFAAAVFPWIAAGFTATEVGTIVGRARVESTATRIRSFMAQGGAAAACFALHAWTPMELGWTIGYVKQRNNPPTDAQFVQIFQICLPMVNRGAPLACTGASVRAMALGAGCGAPVYATLIQRAPLFGTNWTGPVARNGIHAAQVFPRGGYRIRLMVTGERRQHVEQNHTYEYTLWHSGNLLREGADGNITFYAVGFGVGAHLTGLVGGGAQGLADNVAAQNQNLVGTDMVGVRSAGPPPNIYPGQTPLFQASLMQCYPTVGAAITGKTLVGIGRLLGQIP
jgi:hypothetical protein